MLASLRGPRTTVALSISAYEKRRRGEFGWNIPRSQEQKLEQVDSTEQQRPTRQAVIAQRREAWDSTHSNEAGGGSRPEMRTIGNDSLVEN